MVASVTRHFYVKILNVKKDIGERRSDALERRAGKIPTLCSVSFVVK